MDTPAITPGIYQHYTGKQYRVHQLVRHSETLEWYVYYEALYHNPKSKYWIRPLAMFTEHIDVSNTTTPAAALPLSKTNHATYPHRRRLMF